MTDIHQLAREAMDLAIELGIDPLVDELDSATMLNARAQRRDLTVHPHRMTAAAHFFDALPIPETAVGMLVQIDQVLDLCQDEVAP